MSVYDQSEDSEYDHDPVDAENPISIEYDNDASEGVRGIVHIFNNYEFEDSENDFPDGKAEGDEVFEVFTALKYKVKVHCNLTKAETDQAFQNIKRTEGLSKENVIIFFILSHGDSKFNYLSRDGQDIDLSEKMQMFSTDECNAMAYKPKVWFGDFCHGDRDQRGVSWYEERKKKASPIEEVKCYGTEDVLTNTVYIMSSSEGFAGVSQSFSPSVCEMLNEGKFTLNDEWRSGLNRKLRRKEAPNSTTTYYDPFPGQLFEGKFSFNYDVDEVNKRKPENR